jgi:hypothetical protein
MLGSCAGRRFREEVNITPPGNSFRRFFFKELEDLLHALILPSAPLGPATQDAQNTVGRYARAAAFRLTVASRVTPSPDGHECESGVARSSDSGRRTETHSTTPSGDLT